MQVKFVQPEEMTDEEKAIEALASAIENVLKRHKAEKGDNFRTSHVLIALRELTFEFLAQRHSASKGKLNAYEDYEHLFGEWRGQLKGRIAVKDLQNMKGSMQ